MARVILPRHFRGVTLVEIMVVVAIIGVGASIAVADWGEQTRRSRATAQALALQDSLIQARNLARSRLKCTKVEVKENGTLVATPHNKCNPLSEPDDSVEFALPLSFTDDFVSNLGKAKTRITVSEFDTEDGALVFNGRGGIDTNEIAEMTVTTEHGTEYTYRIFPAIGAVRLILPSDK